MESGFEACFDWDPKHMSVLGAKHISNPDWGAILISRVIGVPSLVLFVPFCVCLLLVGTLCKSIGHNI